MASRPLPYYGTLSGNSNRPKASYPSTSSHIVGGPFGPAMARDVFELWGDDCEAVPEGYYDEGIKDGPMEEEDLFDGETKSYHFRYQGELNLESVAEMSDRLRSEIRQFRAGYAKMSIYALKWHYLMQEVEANPQVKKMFKDMQLMRKLNGSDGV